MQEKFSVRNKKTEPLTALPSLGERIRTSGLLNPIQARYQTAPHPDILLPSAGSKPNRTTSDNISRLPADVNSFSFSFEMKKAAFPGRESSLMCKEN